MFTTSAISLVKSSSYVQQRSWLEVPRHAIAHLRNSVTINEKVGIVSKETGAASVGN